MLDASAVSTGKIYYDDAYCAEFEANVVSFEGNALVLDRTAFFPEEGGQSCDLGEIDGIRVKDVQIRDGQIVHFLGEAAETGDNEDSGCSENTDSNAESSDSGARFAIGQTVHGKIDWSRRYDLMQQHSGEHLLSGYVHRKYGFENVGFHLTPQEVTLDFDRQIPSEDIPAIEAEVNRLIRSNIASQTVFLSPGRQTGSAEYPTGQQKDSAENPEITDYRSKLDLEGEVRVVVYPGADACACCAPHVRLTGEIGSLKIVSMINWKGGVRLTIACGARATVLFTREHELLTGTSRFLTTSPEEVLPQVTKMKDQLRNMSAKLKEQETALLLHELEAAGREREPADHELEAAGHEREPADHELEAAGLEGETADHELEDSDHEGGKQDILDIFGESDEKENHCAVIFKEEADADAVLKAADSFAKKYGRDAVVFTGTGEEKNFLIAGPKAQELLKELKERFQVKGGGRGELVRGRVRM